MLGALAGREKLQSIMLDDPIDYKDMTAYVIGLIMYIQAEPIAQTFYNWKNSWRGKQENREESIKSSTDSRGR